MRPLFEIFYIQKIQKRIVYAEIIRGNTVSIKLTLAKAVSFKSSPRILMESNADGFIIWRNQILTEWNSDTVLIEFLNSEIGNFQEIFKNSIAICSSDVWHIRILQEFQSEFQPESTRILITKSHESTLIRDAIVRCLFDY